MTRWSVLLAAGGLALTIWLTAQPASAALLNARPFTHADFGSSTWDAADTELHNIFNIGGTGYDGLVTSGTAIDVVNDQIAAAVFQPAAAEAFATLIIEVAGYRDGNVFGIYEFGNPSNKVPLFPGAVSPVADAKLKFVADGSVFSIVVDDDDTDVDFGTTNFGFYLHTQADDIFYSEDELNGGNPQALIYGGNSQQLDLDLSPAAAATKIVTFDSDSIIIAWEDLPFPTDPDPDYLSNDLDFNDMVVFISGVRPVPEAASVIVWLLLGLFGIAFTRRRRSCTR